jgi:hypothetical protein
MPLNNIQRTRWHEQVTMGAGCKVPESVKDPLGY